MGNRLHPRSAQSPAWLRSLGLLLAFALLAGQAHAQSTARTTQQITSQITIRTAAQIDTVPKFIAHSNQPNAPVDGLCIDIDRAIERIDPTLHISGDQSWMPPNRVVAELNAGHLDMGCGFVKIAERKNLHFIEPPLFTTDFVLVARANDPVVIHNWADLRALGDQAIVLVDHDFALVNTLATQGGLHVDDTTLGLNENLQKLRAGKGRFYIHRLLGLVDGIKRANMNAEVRILPVSLERQSYYMIFAQQAPNEMVQRTQKAITAMVKSGEMMKLLQKWSNIFVEPQKPETQSH
jgi:polar amino acid transport system substrate-binding protein